MAGRSRESSARKTVAPETTRLITDRATEPAPDISLASIAEKIGSLRFRRSLWGADERDVLIKIRRIDEMYRELYREQEIRYRTLLEERDRQVRTLRRRLDRM